MADIDLFSIIQIADIFFMLAISISYCTVSSTIWGIYSEFLTTWKVSVFGVFLVRIFPAFGLNTERYSLSLRIQCKCEKIRTRKNWIRIPFAQCKPTDSSQCLQDLLCHIIIVKRTYPGSKKPRLKNIFPKN